MLAALAPFAAAVALVHVPAATLETGSSRVALAVSSWCAGTKCGAPLGAATRPAVARRGATVRLVLGFAPRTVSVVVGGVPVRSSRSGDALTWSAGRGGGLTVTAATPSLSVTYVGRLILR